MKIFLAVLFIGYGVICKSQVRPLKGEYPNLPYEININKPYDSVWNNLVRFFTEQGYPIHVQNKTEGLIVSDRFNIKWTYEKKGELKDTTALIVVPMYHNKSNNTTIPEPKFNGILSGELNATLKVNKNSVLVVFNITNIQKATYNIKDGNTMYIPYTDYKSTGAFEKKLSYYLQ